MRAIRTYRSNVKNTRFPLPAVLMESIKPFGEKTENIAIETANRIISAIKRHGYVWPEGLLENGERWYYAKQKDHYAKFRNWKDAALAELGSLGFEVVQFSGGWFCLCEDESDLGIKKAQLRQLAEALYEKAKSGRDIHVAPELPQISVDRFERPALDQNPSENQNIQKITNLASFTKQMPKE